MPPALAQQHAVCALHPTQAATGVCSRCGGFVCQWCQGQGAYPTCPACRERTGEGQSFALSRDAWTVGELLSRSWDAFAANWLMLSLGMLLVTVVGWIISFGSQQLLASVMGKSLVAGVVGTLGVWLLQAVVQQPLTLGLASMAHAALMGRGADFGELLLHFGKIPKILALLLLTGLLAIAAMLPLIALLLLVRDAGPAVMVMVTFLAMLPLVWLLLPLYFAQYEIAFDDEVSATDAVKNAFAVGKGKRLALCGVSLLAGLVALVGLLALCVGVIASVAFAQVIAVALYLTLRNGTGLPAFRRHRQV